MADIHKIGLLAVRDGKMLLCRKKSGTGLLILPGGKLEPGESAIECLQREVREELGGASVSELTYVGSYSDRAATSNEVPQTVSIELYSGELVGEPTPSSEIAELVWFSANDNWEVLAPSLRNRIVRDLLARGLLAH